MMITNSINAIDKQKNRSSFVCNLYINVLKFLKLLKIAINSIHFFGLYYRFRHKSEIIMLIVTGFT